MADRLARLSGVSVGNFRAFGAGAEQAQVRYRAETVAYGYLGVVEEYVDPATDASWCTLTVTLPAPVPTVTVDHRSAFGRPGVPGDGWQHGALGSPAFDEAYIVTSLSGGSEVLDLVRPAMRESLLQRPVQRLALSGTTLVLRTFDGTPVSAAVSESLRQLAASILAATPGFVTPMGVRSTFPPGLYGPNVDDSSRSGAQHRSTQPGRFGRLAARRD